MIRKAIFMQTITVQLGERSYPIHIERGLLAKTGEMIREKLGDIAVAVVSDDHVAPLYMEEVVSSMEKVGAARVQHCSAARRADEVPEIAGNAVCLPL